LAETGKPKVLVAGASGLLGTSLVPALRAAGHRVATHGFSKSSGCDHSADTSDGATVEAMLAAARPDVVVNLVAATNVDHCENRPDDAWRLNVKSVETLAARAAAHDFRLVHISTDQVYDGPGPHREDDVAILNVYGLSKRAGELAALSAGGTVLRTNFFGPSRLAGRMSFSDWVIAKLRAGEAFTGFDDVLFSPLTMASLCDAIIRVLERPRPGVFNLGSRGGMSKADFVFAVARRYGLDASAMRRGSQADVQLRARRPGDMRMDTSLFEATFDFILPALNAEIARLEIADA